MKTRLIALTLCLVTAVSVSVLALGTLFAWMFKSQEDTVSMTPHVNKQYFEGEGTAGDPYLIAYPIQLYYFAWLQDMGYFNDDGSNAAQGYKQAPVYFEVTEDLDMTGYTLPCIGTADMPFLGVFNGGCHVISNLTVTNKGADFYQQPANTSTIPGAQIVGFFGVIGEIDPDAVYDTQVPTAQNFALHNVTVKTDTPTGDVSMIGIVAGYVNGTVENVLVSACTVSVAESIGAMTTYTTNQSDYTLVGYAAKDQYVRNVGHLDEATPGYGPGTGGGDGEGDQFGGSIDMLNIYKRLTMLQSEYFTSYSGENLAGYSTAGDYAFLTTGNPRYVFLYGGPAADFSSVPNSDQKNNLFKVYPYQLSSVKSDGFYIQNPAGQYMNISSDGSGLDAGDSPTTVWKITDGYLYGTATVTLKISNSNSVERQVVRFIYASGSYLSALAYPVSGSNVWSLDGSGKLLVSGNAGTVIYYDGEQWKFYNGEAQYRITDKNGHYLKLNSGLNGFENSNEADATLWTCKIATTTFTIYTYVEGYYYFISCNRSGSTYTLTVYRATTSSPGNSSYRNFKLGSTITSDVLKLSSFSVSGQLTYSSGWKYSTRGNAYAVEVPVSITESSKATTVAQANSVYEVTNITALLSAANAPIAETYFPLLTASGTIGARQDNVGYIVSGSNYVDGILTVGDIRFSEYYTSDLSASDPGDVNDNDATALVYSIAPNGTAFNFTDNMFKDSSEEVQTLVAETHELTQYYNRTTQINGEDVAVEGAKSKFFSTMREGDGNIYGLHFMNASIGTSNVFAADKGVWVTGTYYADGYQFPRDCVDFNVAKEGKITFFAGTYFEGNNAFFSLHEVDRTGATINAIREIKKIYRNNSTGEIEYTYDNSTKGDGYTLLFDTANITNPSSFTNNAIYYFEIPVKAGEYLLGSVPGKTGAYLMYLDIAASGGDGDQGNVVDKFTNKYEVFQTPEGIQLATADEIGAYTNATVVDDTDSASYALTGFSGSVEIKKEIENGKTVYKYYLNGSNTGTEITGVTRYEMIRITTATVGSAKLYTFQVSGLLTNAGAANVFTDVASFRYAGSEDAIADVINCVFIKDNTYEVRFNITSNITITDFTALNAYDVTAKSVGTGTLTQTTS